MEENKMKNNWKIISIILLTFVLGCVAIITSLKLYQNRKTPVAPTAPGKTPAAGPACTFTFTVASPTPFPTLPPGVTATPSPRPTASPIPTLPPGVSPTPTIVPPVCPMPETSLIKINTCNPAITAPVRIYNLTSASVDVLDGYDIKLAYFLGKKSTNVQAVSDGIFSLKGAGSCSPQVGSFVAITASNTKFEYIEFAQKLSQINNNFIILEPFSYTEFGPDSKLYLCIAPKPSSTPIPTTIPSTTPTPTPTNTPEPTVTPTTPPGATATPTTPPGATATPTTPWWATQTPTSPYHATATPTSPYYATGTPTPVYYAGTTPTPEVTLPQAGFTLPTIGLTVGGTILFIFSLLLLL